MVPYPKALIEPKEKRTYKKNDFNYDTILEVLKQVKVNLPLIEAIKQIPNYAKVLKDLCRQKRHPQLPEKEMVRAHVSAMILGILPPKLPDPGAPVIPIQVGNFKIDRALLDLGASVSILLGSLYDEKEFGPLHKVLTTVVLADLTCKLPRGMVRDVIVKVGEFYYPVDFLVLDYLQTASNQQQTVILGRPYLNTSYSIINCRLGTVDMVFGSRKARLNIYTNETNYLTDDECHMADIIDGCTSSMGEGIPSFYFDDRLEKELDEELAEVETLALKEGRPPWSVQVDVLPAEISSGIKPSLENPPKV